MTLPRAAGRGDPRSRVGGCPARKGRTGRSTDTADGARGLRTSGCRDLDPRRSRGPGAGDLPSAVTTSGAGRPRRAQSGRHRGPPGPGRLQSGRNRGQPGTLRQRAARPPAQADRRSRQRHRQGRRRHAQLGGRLRAPCPGERPPCDRRPRAGGAAGDWPGKHPRELAQSLLGRLRSLHGRGARLPHASRYREPGQGQPRSGTAPASTSTRTPCPWAWRSCRWPRSTCCSKPGPRESARGGGGETSRAVEGPGSMWTTADGLPVSPRGAPRKRTPSTRCPRNRSGTVRSGTVLDPWTSMR